MREKLLDKLFNFFQSGDMLVYLPTREKLQLDKELSEINAIGKSLTGVFIIDKSKNIDLGINSVHLGGKTLYYASMSDLHKLLTKF